MSREGSCGGRKKWSDFGFILKNTANILAVSGTVTWEETQRHPPLFRSVTASAASQTSAALRSSGPPEGKVSRWPCPLHAPAQSLHSDTAQPPPRPSSIRKPDETPFQQLRLQASSLEMSLQCGLITVSKLIVLTSGFTGERARPLAGADAARARGAAHSGWREYTDGMKEHQSWCARCLASNRNTVVGVKVLDVLLPLSPLSRV
ncbi:unnamed protein product [Rangifer tarandus platyrhynchus]|uniref:Uncharacterized protein n=1 Tax=Rangifer tarandus platyrhynchus TaxID=3082113 RepID=A0AC59YYN4_RANTA